MNRDVWLVVLLWLPRSGRAASSPIAAHVQDHEPTPQPTAGHGSLRAHQRGHGLGVSLEVYAVSDLQQKIEAVTRLESEVIRP